MAQRLEADAAEVLASAANLLKSEPNMVKLQASHNSVQHITYMYRYIDMLIYEYERI